MNIKEIRNTTGLSQRSFSKMFNIPISTLQKWEQGESSPTPYIIKLIANQLPIDNDNMCKIEDNNGKIYYYNRDAGYLIDSIGTKIQIGEDLNGVKEKNLSLYVADLFESYYEIVDKFNRDCRLDKTEDIIWSSIEINNHKEAYIMSRRGTNIRKRTDGCWEGRYYIVDTAGSKKCKSVYGHSYKEVTERLLTAKAASLNQTVAPKQPAITVKAVAEKWLESIATSRKCSTIQKYSTIYNKYIKPNWGESVIDELNQNEILKELPETAGESITKSILCIFNSILAYGAATYGTGEIHLSYRAKRSSVTSSNNINTINTTDQQKLTEYLLTELDIYKLGILLCLFMGLRLGEICALKWEDIDMISRTLHVNRTVQRLPVDTVHTSGSSQNNHTATRKTSLYIDSPKTSNSLREIPIPDFIYDKLSDYYNTSMKGDSYFLKKNQPMDPRTYQNRFHIYIREAGIGNTHFHALRHTFATNCISSGADAKSVSEILGHSNVNITLNRYVHPNLETKRSAINSIVIP